MMNLKMAGAAATLAACVAAMPAQAAPTSYQCVISGSYETDTGGALGKQDKQLTGVKFGIDRLTGAIAGPEKGIPWSWRDSTTTVLAKGSFQNEFVALIYSEGGSGSSHATLVRVREWQAGRTKPFMVMTGMTMHVGTCE